MPGPESAPMAKAQVGTGGVRRCRHFCELHGEERFVKGEVPSSTNGASDLSLHEYSGGVVQDHALLKRDAAHLKPGKR